MNAFLSRFLRDSAGATSIEYALLVAVVSLVPVAAFGAGGELVSGLIDQAAMQLAVAAPGPGINVLPPAN
jgi:Flp pilus assembly pilin Flp